LFRKILNYQNIFYKKTVNQSFMKNNCPKPQKKPNLFEMEFASNKTPIIFVGLKKCRFNYLIPMRYSFLSQDTRKLVATLTVFLLCFCLQVAFAQTPKPEAGKGDVAKGKELFAQNCANCHKIHAPATGPALSGVTKRHSEAWLIKWIRNSQSLVKAGDAAAVKVFNEWGGIQMNSFPDFSDDDIRGILAYIESVPVPEKTQATASGGGGVKEASGGDSGYTNIILGALVVVLVIILVVLLVLTSLLTRLLKQRDDLTEADREIVESKIDIGKILGSKAFLGLLTAIVFLVVAKMGIDKVMDIGMQQGYAPTQPIAFSHKLHVGKYQIACQYCHTTVMKGKSASIPSANICMNCHNAVKNGSPEIQKIYTAIEKNQPIQWVRVHNLPDLVYFNHSQHTVVGKVACEQCHGQIEQMEVVQQRSPLTMGWCIDCHRQTLVSYTVKDGDGKDQLNPYYEKLLAFHKSKGKTKFKVEDIGGLECSKCHY
jgi:mono/diheme cytochrome c family protein